MPLLHEEIVPNLIRDKLTRGRSGNPAAAAVPARRSAVSREAGTRSGGEALQRSTRSRRRPGNSAAAGMRPVLLLMDSAVAQYFVRVMRFGALP
jgi:hypothetical protein